MNQTVQFRVSGSPEPAVEVPIEETKSVYEVKQIVREQFGINNMLGLQLISKGKVLIDESNFIKSVDTKLPITAMVIHAGG